jgi:hypothetical protein
MTAYYEHHNESSRNASITNQYLVRWSILEPKSLTSLMTKSSFGGHPEPVTLTLILRLHFPKSMLMLSFYPLVQICSCFPGGLSTKILHSLYYVSSQYHFIDFNSLIVTHDLYKLSSSSLCNILNFTSSYILLRCIFSCKLHFQESFRVKRCFEFRYWLNFVYGICFII